MRTLGRRIDFGEAKMYTINEVCSILFTSYVLLRKTQSSVSLRLTAPFQRSLSLRGTRERPRNLKIKEMYLCN